MIDLDEFRRKHVAKWSDLDGKRVVRTLETFADDGRILVFDDGTFAIVEYNHTFREFRMNPWKLWSQDCLALGWVSQEEFDADQRERQGKGREAWRNSDIEHARKELATVRDRWGADALAEALREIPK